MILDLALPLLIKCPMSTRSCTNTALPQPLVFKGYSLGPDVL